MIRKARRVNFMERPSNCNNVLVFEAFTLIGKTRLIGIIGALASPMNGQSGDHRQEILELAGRHRSILADEIEIDVVMPEADIHFSIDARDSLQGSKAPARRVA